MIYYYFVIEEVFEFQDFEIELLVICDDCKVLGYICMEQKKGFIGIYEKENLNFVWYDYCLWDYENWLFDVDYDCVMFYFEESFNCMLIFVEFGIS